MSNHQRSLKNLVLNRSMQVGFAAIVVSIAAVIALVLGTLIYRQLARASRIAAEMTAELGIDQQVARDMAASDTAIIFKIVVVGLAVAAILGGVLIVVTHKVAGPLYKIAKYFETWERGEFAAVTPERRGDMLEDFYREFVVTHQGLAKQDQDVTETLQRIIAALDAAPGRTTEQVEAIGALQNLVARRAMKPGS